MSTELQQPWKFENPVCSQIGTVMFFADDEDDPDAIDSNIINTQEAKKICQMCEHKFACAEWGIRHERYGVWGGLSPYELIAARKNRNIVMQTITLPRVL